MAIVTVLVGLSTVALDIVSGGDPVITSLPVLLVAALWAMWVAPVRWSASVATLVALTLPISRDGEGHWAGPLGTLGDLWQLNIDVTVPASHIKMSGFELVVLFLVVVVLHRRATGNDIDLRDRLPTAALLRDTAVLAFVGVLFATVNGLVHGGAGQIAIWHMRPILRYLVLLAVYQAAYRGPRDYRLVAQIVVGAAAVRALMATYILVTIVEGKGLKIDSTTSHGDSVLFATAIVILLAGWLETQNRRELLRRAPLLFLILYGAHANNRRLAWVELTFALVFILMVTPWVAWKRRALQTAAVLLPVVALYVAAGWDSGGGRLFAPVRTLRSVVDTKTDRSAWDSRARGLEPDDVDDRAAHPGARLRLRVHGVHRWG